MLEHNSVVRPLMELEREGGIEITFLKGDVYGEVAPSAVAAQIRSNTRLIVCTLSANTNGIVMPVAEMGALAHRCGIPGAQGPFGSPGNRRPVRFGGGHGTSTKAFSG